MSDINKEIEVFNENLIKIRHGKLIDIIEYTKILRRKFKGYVNVTKSYENYKDQNDAWLFVNEKSDDELSVPISNIKIMPPQQEPLDSIIIRALNRIDPYIEYFIRENLKTYPKTLNKKTNRNSKFESEIIQSPRTLTNEELNKVYERVSPVWVSKSAKIDERRPEPSPFLKQKEAKPVEPVVYKPIKPVIPQKQVPIKFIEDNLENLTFLSTRSSQKVNVESL